MWHWFRTISVFASYNILWAHVESIAQAINILSDTKCYIFINTTSNDLLPIFCVAFIIPSSDSENHLNPEKSLCSSWPKHLWNNDTEWGCWGISLCWHCFVSSGFASCFGGEHEQSTKMKFKEKDFVHNSLKLSFFSKISLKTCWEAHSEGFSL